VLLILLLIGEWDYNRTQIFILHSILCKKELKNEEDRGL